MSCLKKRIIYFFDSAGSIRSLRLVNHSRNRKENNLDSVAVIDSSIELPDEIGYYFDRWYVVEAVKREDDPCLLDESKVIEALKPEFEDEVPVTIISFGEYTSIVAAKIREFFKLDGPKVADVIPFRDKLEMKRVVGSAVRVPKNIKFCRSRFEAEPTEYTKWLGAQIPFPLIIKPVNAASACGVRVLHDEKCEHTIVEAISEYTGDFEVEEYIEGTMFHCEVILKDKKPIVALASRFNHPVIAMRKGLNVGSIPLLINDPLYNRVVDFCIKAVTAMPINDGVTHTELLLDRNDNFYFIETANRTPGGRVIESYITSHNVNILDLDQRIKVGLPIQLEKQTTGKSAFWLAIPQQKGMMKSLTHWTDGCHINTKYNIGDEMGRGGNFEEIFGTALVTKDSYSDLVSFFELADTAKFFEIK